MKRCPKCHSTFTDTSLTFCTMDGTQLTDTPLYDSEAETLKSPAPKLKMSAQDMIMEIADYLRRTLDPGEQTLIRFEPLTGLGLTVAQVSEHFEAAAQRAQCIVIEKTDTRATVRREQGGRIVRG